MRSLGICALLAALVAAIYWRSATFDFVSLDDPTYVSRNDHVLGGLSAENAQWAFSHFYASFWIPLTWLSLQLDASLFGYSGGYHLTNAILHALNAVLLFAFLKRATNQTGPSTAVAALFAVHPIHVESVAWVTERKDVLSVFFGLLALWAYVRYAQQKGMTAYGLSLA